MPFDLDRMDGTPFLPMLRPENVLVQGDEAMIKLDSPPDIDVELYFPAPGGVFGPEALGLAAEVLAQLTAMDNEVQRASAAAWAGSSLPSSYYEGELYLITLTPPGEAVLRYSVIGCNAEWDERFVCSGGRWTRVVSAEPGGCTGHRPPRPVSE